MRSCVASSCLALALLGAGGEQGYDEGEFQTDIASEKGDSSSLHITFKERENSLYSSY